MAKAAWLAHPAAGCNDRANAGHREKTRRPEGFRAKGRGASLLRRSKTHQGYSPSSRLARQPFPRKQDLAEFSDGLLDLDGRRGLDASVEWKTTLNAAVWQKLAEFTASVPFRGFTDSGASGYTQRFYREVRLP